MKLERVMSELFEKGIYRRGDSEVTFKRIDDHIEVSGRYDPKPGYEISKPVVPGISIEEMDNKFYFKSHAQELADAVKPIVEAVNSVHYPDRHITRRAGCYIEIRNEKVTKVGKPRLEYCPLAEKTFCKKFTKEGIKKAIEKRISDGAFSSHRCVIKETERIPFGASETFSDAQRDNKLDAAVTVCEGAGTVISDKPEVTQGIGARMTGVFHTTPIRDVIEKLEEEAFVVFPETAGIDQVLGTKFAKELGYKRIGTTMALDDSMRLKELKEIGDVTAYALCSTGIKRKTAYEVVEHADLVCSCASKYVDKIIRPNSILQVGIKIPIYVLTERGIDLVISRFRHSNFNNVDEIVNGLKNIDPERKYLISHEKYNLYLKEEEELPGDEGTGPRPLI
jgi:putative methanogenesis marker protein 8